MKKHLLFPLVLLCVLLPLASMASEEIIKTGWNVGVLPAIAFNSDLGFEYGAILNMFNYGDGTNYPNYEHSLYFEVSRFTKGSGIYRFYYDSEYLIPDIRLTADVSYLVDEAYRFFGYNGYDAVYNVDWEDDEADDYKTRMYYRYQRNLFRAKADFQGKLGPKNLKWIGGFGARNFDISSVDIGKLNKDKDDEDLLPTVTEQPGIYEKYLGWGLIPDAHKNGGYISTIKAGLVYDSRPVLANPSSGIWTEAVVIYSPAFLGSDEEFTRFSITHRQYLGLIPNRLTFAYRLGYQTRLSGKVPFYYQPLIATSVMTGATNEGLGGMRSMRGILLNRIIGDGIAFGNFELRSKVLFFKVKKQNFYIGVNGFVDAGQVTQKIEYDEEMALIEEAEKEGIFDTDAEKIHFSAGLGLKIAMNQNFILSIDFGKAFDEQDGTSGLYIGLNYLF